MKTSLQFLLWVFICVVIAGNSYAQGNQTKVTVCHKGHSICIDNKAVPAHLALGSTLGGCSSKYQGDEQDAGLINEGSLIQCYPNPFSNTVNILFSSRQTALVQVRILDLSGREIEILFEENVGADEFESIQWNAGNNIPGIYICQMTTGAELHLQKIVLIY